MNTFFIADTHFYDMDIAGFENRPFKDKEELNNYMIEKWNSKVTKDDEVFLLGDFSNGSKEEDIDVLNKLNGTKYLVLGNHDTKGIDYYKEIGFNKVYDFPIIYKSFYMLSHEPLYTSVNAPYANIYGHVHMNDMYKDFSCHSYLVSAERLDYTPISFDDIKSTIMKLRDDEMKKQMDIKNMNILMG